jgi:DNA-binding MarR family transcriptional regulator
MTYEDFVGLTTTALHQLTWRLRLDQLGTWSPRLRGMAQIDLHILKMIAERPQALLKDVGNELRLPPSTLTSAINRLEKRGLLERHVHPHDRRSYDLKLTPKGWEIKGEHDQVDREITLRLLDTLDSESERQQFVTLLVKITTGLEENLDNTE